MENKPFITRLDPYFFNMENKPFITRLDPYFFNLPLSYQYGIGSAGFGA
jgi:hypothetical protein